MIRKLIFTLIMLSLSMCGVVFAQTGGVAIPVTLQAARTVTGATINDQGTMTVFDPVSGTELRNVQSGLCTLIVSGVAGTAATTFTVWIQVCAEANCTQASATGWDDQIAFPSTVANGRAVASWSSGTATIGAAAAHAIQDGALAAGTIRGGPFGNRLRIRAKSTGGDGTTAITYAVVCYLDGNV